MEPGGCDVEHVETSASLLKTFISYSNISFFHILRLFGKNVHLVWTLIFHFCFFFQFVLHILLTSSCDEKQMHPRDGPTFTIFGRSHLYLYILPVKEKMCEY